MIFGNSRSQNELKNFLQNHQRTVALTGPSQLGKHSFARESIEGSVHPTDSLFMGDGIDGVREATEFCRNSPLNGDFRILVVDDAGSLGEPAQDALLKMTEEPHSSMKVVLIAHDLGHLQPALRSRIRHVLKWSPLSANEMKTYAESISAVVCSPLLALSSGLPGLYRAMMESAGFEELYEYVVRISQSEARPFMQQVPEIVKSLKGPGLIRDAVVNVLRIAARRSNPVSRSLPILRFCDTIEHSISANAELHWMRMTACLSDVI